MEKQIIEVNGIKMEVDLRHAVRIDNFKVGDPVKILLVNDNSVKSGVIVEFEQFEKLPTIVVAYIKTDYFTSGLDFAYINQNSSDKYELIASDKDTLLSVDRASVIGKMDDEITKKEQEVIEMKRRKEFFIKRFGVYFQSVETA